jgi:hypothetical protein
MSTDIQSSVDFYAAKIYNSPHKDEALAVIAIYFDENWRRMNVQQLSDLAAVFTDELEYTNEYNKICKRIQHFIRLTQTEAQPRDEDMDDVMNQIRYMEATERPRVELRRPARRAVIRPVNKRRP